MSFHYDATSDFHTSIAEVETLLTLASSDDTNRTLFLKLSIVSLVTKFQVFVEKILEDILHLIRKVSKVALERVPIPRNGELKVNNNFSI